MASDEKGDFTPAAKPVTVDEYINGFEGEVKARLILMRKTIKGMSPDISEKISWGMPTFIYGKPKGVNLVHFAAAKNHIGFYPSPSAVEKFANELQGYKTSKGAIQFSGSKPIPHELVEKIVRFRMKEIDSD